VKPGVLSAEVQAAQRAAQRRDWILEISIVREMVEAAFAARRPQEGGVSLVWIVEVGQLHDGGAAVAVALSEAAGRQVFESECRTVHNRWEEVWQSNRLYGRAYQTLEAFLNEQHTDYQYRCGSEYVALRPFRPVDSK